MNIAELLPELLKGLANFTLGNAIMITAALILVYLAVFKEIEPVLLLPMVSMSAGIYSIGRDDRR